MQQKYIKKIKENIAVRILAYPAEQIRRKIRLFQFHNSEHPAYIKSLKGIHNGEACFIIGNGPSLKPEDLDLLDEAGMACFAANRIYKIFPETHWRPTYYMVLDGDVISEDLHTIVESHTGTIFTNYISTQGNTYQHDNVHCLCPYEPFLLNPQHMYTNTLSDDPSKVSTKCSTVTVASIELAVYMGFKTIYLLGVDNNYKHVKKADGSVEVDPTMTSSYFVGGEPSKSLGPSIVSAEYFNEAYEAAKRFAIQHDIKIYNATRGGKLEVFERVNFDKLFRN